MARAFDGSSHYLIGGSAPVIGNLGSINAHAKPSASVTSKAVVSIGTNGGVSRIQDGTAGSSEAIQATSANTGGSLAGANSSASYSSGVWAQSLAVFTSATSRAAYKDGGNKGTDTLNISASGQNRILVGARYSTTVGAYWPGSIAEVAVWDTNLGDDHAAMLGKGFSPILVKPENLVGYWPLYGNASPEIDLFGKVDLTVNSATKAADHPRVFTPRRR